MAAAKNLIRNISPKVLIRNHRRGRRGRGGPSNLWEFPLRTSASSAVNSGNLYRAISLSRTYISTKDREQDRNKTVVRVIKSQLNDPQCSVVL